MKSEVYRFQSPTHLLVGTTYFLQTWQVSGLGLIWKDSPSPNTSSGWRLNTRALHRTLPWRGPLQTFTGFPFHPTTLGTKFTYEVVMQFQHYIWCISTYELYFTRYIQCSIMLHTFIDTYEFTILLHHKKQRANRGIYDCLHLWHWSKLVDILA